jgi:hypothetical protein
MFVLGKIFPTKDRIRLMEKPSVSDVAEKTYGDNKQETVSASIREDWRPKSFFLFPTSGPLYHSNLGS